MEAEARADQVAGKRPHRRGCITPGPWPLVSRELPSFMAKGGQIERRTADEVRREAAALAVRLDEKARRLDWAGQAQVTCWMAHCDTCGRETTHTGRGCSECRPRLGPLAKALQGRELCDLCHCPGAMVAVDSSDSYTTNVYHNVCARCLQRLLRGELARLVPDGERG